MFDPVFALSTTGNPVLAIVGIIIVVIVVLWIFFSLVPVGLWISAMAAGVRLGIFNLIGMRLRRVVPSRIVNPLIKASKAGLAVNVNKLEAHYLAGGNVDRVVNALIAAQRANIPLEFERAAAIDLAGHPGVLLLSAGTDGTDGPTDAAGAFADGTTVSRAAARQMSARRYLAENDSYAFFQPLGDLFITGPTRTNVMDLQVLLVDAISGP